jgi:hypothetical protein
MFFLQIGVLQGQWHGHAAKFDIRSVSARGSFDGVAEFTDAPHAGVSFPFTGAVLPDGSLRLRRVAESVIQTVTASPPVFVQAQFIWRGDTFGDGIPSGGLPFALFGAPFVDVGPFEGQWHGHAVKFNVLRVLDNNVFVGITEFVSGPHTGVAFSFEGTVSPDGFHMSRNTGTGLQTADTGPRRFLIDRFVWTGRTVGDGIPPEGLPFEMKPAVATGSPEPEAPTGLWAQRFHKVHDALELRIGGPQGPLVQSDGVGVPGKYTMTWRDRVPHDIDLAPWVGDRLGASLWARIHELPGGSGDHQCDMDTMYKGTSCQRWEFDEDEAHFVVASAAGWQQRFDKVHDAVQLRLGVGGPVITWPGRGIVIGGEQYTWCWNDPVPEVQSFKDSNLRNLGIEPDETTTGFGLWARVVRMPRASGDHQCDMDTLFAGSQVQRWEFDEVEDHAMNVDSETKIVPANIWTQVISRGPGGLRRYQVTVMGRSDVEVKSRRFGIGPLPFWEGSFKGSDTFTLTLLDVFTRIDILSPVDVTVLVTHT